MQEKKQKRAESMDGKRKIARTAAEATASMLSKKVWRVWGRGRVWGLGFGVWGGVECMRGRKE